MPNDAQDAGTTTPAIDSRVTVDGWEYVYCGNFWVGYADPWTPVVVSDADMAEQLLVEARKCQK